MPTVFGDNTIEATTYGASAQSHLQKYVAAASGTITQVFIYCRGNTGTATPLLLGMYADSAGTPGALLGLSNSLTIPNGQAAGWIECDMTAAVAIVSGTTYWVAMSDNGGSATFAYGTSGGVGSGRGGFGLPNPYGVPGWLNVSDHFSLYANIDPVGVRTKAFTIALSIALFPAGAEPRTDGTLPFAHTTTLGVPARVTTLDIPSRTTAVT